jgi:hypothetical protein
MEQDSSIILMKLQFFFFFFFFRLQPNMKCIIFVNRIVTARLLSYILQKLKFLAYWKCDFLVGVHTREKCMSRKTMNIILERFRSGKVMLIFKVLTLVASFLWQVKIHQFLRMSCVSLIYYKIH